MPRRARSERVTYASAHHVRRSFGERWAMRDLPPVRQELIRHERIQTTLPYYARQNAARTAEAVWPPFSSQNGKSLGNTARTDGGSAAAGSAVSSVQTMS